MKPFTVLSLLVRLAVTAFAFWWVLRLVDVDSLKGILRAADPAWLLAAVALFLISEAACVVRWRLLAPTHPSVKLPFLANSFLVAQFFNVFLPSTIGGDVIRGYDLIKATGEWKGSLASILMDRLVGFAGSAGFAAVAWALFPPARQDPVIRSAFAGICILLVVILTVLGSRRVLRTMLNPFSRIGLGTLEAHAKQFQKALRDYLRQPGKMLGALGMTGVIQFTWILMFAAVTRALNIRVPVIFLVLVIPIIMLVSQMPVSLNGWGVRESATVLLLGRIGVPAVEALSLSLVGAAMPFIGATAGAILFLARRQKKPRPT